MATVRTSQRCGIIDAVAQETYCVAIRLQNFDEARLLPAARPRRIPSRARPKAAKRDIVQLLFIPAQHRLAYVETNLTIDLARHHDVVTGEDLDGDVVLMTPPRIMMNSPAS
jgi:hypothetical protein